MKLGIVSFNFPPVLGGMENHAIGLCAELAERIDIEVFTSSQLAPPPCEFPVHRVLVRDVVHDIPTLLRHSCDGWLSLTAGYAQLAAAASNPVLVYCHGNDFVVPFVMQRIPWEPLLQRMDRVPVVWRSKEWLQALNAPLRRREVIDGIKHAAHVFANSNYTRDIVLRFVPEMKERISVSNPGVDERFFLQDIVTTPWPSDAPIRITTISRLQTMARRKNVDGCLRALAHVKEQLPFTYTVIGDGDDRHRLERLSADLGLADRTRFLGALPTDAMIRRLDETDLFLLVPIPSKTDLEGFGIVYVEAAARGVPSMLTALGPVDTVRDGETGIVISGVSTRDIADGILRFARERHRWDRRRIRQFGERFRWSAIVDAMLPVIERGLRGARVATEI